MPARKEKEPVKTSIRVLNSYTHYLRLPADVIKKLGLQLSREVTLEVTQGTNPLSWEIKVKPIVESNIE